MSRPSRLLVLLLLSGCALLGSPDGTTVELLSTGYLVDNSVLATDDELTAYLVDHQVRAVRFVSSTTASVERRSQADGAARAAGAMVVSPR